MGRRRSVTEPALGQGWGQTFGNPAGGNLSKGSTPLHHETELPCFCWHKAPTCFNFTKANGEEKRRPEIRLFQGLTQSRSLFPRLSKEPAEISSLSQASKSSNQLQTSLISATPASDSTSSEPLPQCLLPALILLCPPTPHPLSV